MCNCMKCRTNNEIVRTVVTPDYVELKKEEIHLIFDPLEKGKFNLINDSDGKGATEITIDILKTLIEKLEDISGCLYGECTEEEEEEEGILVEEQYKVGDIVLVDCVTLEFKGEVQIIKVNTNKRLEYEALANPNILDSRFCFYPENIVKKVGNVRTNVEINSIKTFKLYEKVLFKNKHYEVIKVDEDTYYISLIGGCERIWVTAKELIKIEDIDCNYKIGESVLYGNDVCEIIDIDKIDAILPYRICSNGDGELYWVGEKDIKKIVNPNPIEVKEESEFKFAVGEEVLYNGQPYEIIEVDDEDSDLTYYINSLEDNKGKWARTDELEKIK